MKRVRKIHISHASDNHEYDNDLDLEYDNNCCHEVDTRLKRLRVCSHFDNDDSTLLSSIQSRDRKMLVYNDKYCTMNRYLRVLHFEREERLRRNHQLSHKAENQIDNAIVHTSISMKKRSLPTHLDLTNRTNYTLPLTNSEQESQSSHQSIRTVATQSSQNVNSTASVSSNTSLYNLPIHPNQACDNKELQNKRSLDVHNQYHYYTVNKREKYSMINVDDDL